MPVVCIWGGSLAAWGVQLPGMGCRLHSRRPSSSLGGPAVGEMGCRLHLGRPSGSPGGRAVGNIVYRLHFGPTASSLGAPAVGVQDTGGRLQFNLIQSGTIQRHLISNTIIINTI